MDSLDIRLLRAQFRGEQFGLEGVDPRPTVQAMSRAVHASRVTVSRRLSRWREDGFWNGLVAFPNPDALGATLQTQAIMIDTERDRARFEAAIARHLEPLLSFQVDNFYGPVFLVHGSAESARKQRDLRAEIGIRTVTPVFDAPFPPSEIRLRNSDWRLLEVLRRSPYPDWEKVADGVGMTLRGLERRLDRLIQANALFFHPLLDFRRLEVSVAWVCLLYGPGADPGEIWAGLLARHPAAFRVRSGFPLQVLAPSEGRPAVAGGIPFFLPAPSGSASDQFRRDIGDVAGVVDVMVAFPTVSTTVPAGIDRSIARARESQPPAS